MSLCLLILSTFIIAQAPTVTWEKYFPEPGHYDGGNYTTYEIKQSPVESEYVLVGSRKMTWKGNGYSEVMLMRIDEDGTAIFMNNHFTGFIYDSIYEGETKVLDTIPWDQVAYDMTVSIEDDYNYLITGYRDTTLLSAETPPGLFLMEVRGDGTVVVDTLYKNDNLDWIMGHCIHPDLEGGYIIAGSIMEDGGGPDQIMMTQVKKNESGKYDVATFPGYFRVNPVGDNGGYATWVRPFGKGYLVAGTARNSDTKSDIFIQRVDDDMFPDCNDCYTTFYGDVGNDEFVDAILSGDTIYLAGSSQDPVSGRYQIYVMKAEPDGSIIWEETYGSSNTLFSKSIMRTSDGNLMVAGSSVVGNNSHIVLLKIDAATGDSLWIEDYATEYYSAGVMDATSTFDFNYVLAGRASVSGTQDPYVNVWKLDNPYEVYHKIRRDHLNLDIVNTTPTKDVIQVSADHTKFRWLCVTIDTLLHPSVGDLEISLGHGETIVTLVDRCDNSGENFIHTSFTNEANASINWWFAPYSAWFVPEESLFPFLFHDPSGEWTLTITDHGTGGIKATTRVLRGWSLKFLTEVGAIGIPTMEEMANFGLEPIRPNPVNQEAVITFQLPKPLAVNLKVYNQLGQEVVSLAHEDLPEGVHSKVWNPGSLAPGAYFIHLEAGGMISVRKAMIVK